jgi:hypothetical protein
MGAMFCPGCGSGQPDEHRFCPRCGRRLPVEGVAKATRLFLGIRTSDADAAGTVLRVSRYLEDHEFSAPEGTVVIPGDHARFSVWVVDRPVAAVSLSGSDAEELGRFLLDPQPMPWPPTTSLESVAG